MKTKSFGVLGSCLVVGSLAGSIAQAQPLHHSMKSDFSVTESACQFPDGTSPVGQPDMHCYTPADFLKAYGVDALHAQGLTGKGQTIILADSYGSPTLQADLDHFSDTFGLPRTTIQFIYPNGAYVNTLSDADHLGWAQETTLDLEWAHALAPDATLVNIVTNVSETTGINGLPELFSGIAMATKQYPNSIVSMSFATGEATFTPSDITQSLQGSLHAILEQATQNGMTLLAGAGDWGSVALNAAQTSMLSAPTAAYPASDPLVTSVGGTALEAGWHWNPQGTAADFWGCQKQKLATCPNNIMAFTESSETSEFVWKEDWAIAATGGGVSSIFQTPSFQASVSASLESQQAQNQRMLPDLSFNAAINGGVDVYTSFLAPKLGVTSPQWQQFGGTSCATPEMAGLVALAGQLASQRLGKQVGIGNLNPLLYQLGPQDFKDIVSQTVGEQNQITLGSNVLYFDENALSVEGALRVTPSSVQGFETTPGFDLTTGLGSPRAVQFVSDLAELRRQEQK